MMAGADPGLGAAVLGTSSQRELAEPRLFLCRPVSQVRIRNVGSFEPGVCIERGGVWRGIDRRTTRCLGGGRLCDDTKV